MGANMEQSNKSGRPAPAPRVNLVSRLLYLPRGISRLEKLGTKKTFPKNHVLVKLKKGKMEML